MSLFHSPSNQEEDGDFLLEPGKEAKGLRTNCRVSIVIGRLRFYLQIWPLFHCLNNFYFLVSISFFL